MYNKIKYMNVIYAIINKINFKFYIGSTNNFRRRRNEHLSDLRRNIHDSKHLQNSFNKHGIKTFEFLILEEVPLNLDLVEIEQCYLDVYKPYLKENGYNMSNKASHPDNSKKYKIIYQYDLNGNFINKYESIASTAKILNIDASGISHCANENKKYSYKNYIFTFTSDEEYIKYRIVKAKRGHSQEIRDKISKSKQESDKIFSKTVIQYDLDGTFIKEWKSIKSACENIGVNSEVLIGCCKGKYKTGKGFIWKYKNN